MGVPGFALRQQRLQGRGQPVELRRSCQRLRARIAGPAERALDLHAASEPIDVDPASMHLHDNPGVVVKHQAVDHRQASSGEQARAYVDPE